MPAHGICLRVTHLQVHPDSVVLYDVNDGVDWQGVFRKPGPVYIPFGQTVELVYSSSVAISFEIGALREFIDIGFLHAEFVFGAGFLPRILDEGILLTATPKSIDFVGAGVTATNVGDDVTVTIPGGGAATDHSLLLAPSLVWTASAHTGAPGSLAAFDGAGAASLITGVNQGDVLFFNGTNWTFLAPGNVGEVFTTQGLGANPLWAPAAPRHDYGVSATDPTLPAPSNGDLYYNSVLDMEMRYDATRGKWLSVEATEFIFSRNGRTGIGQYYRAANNRIMSATNGWYALYNGTVVSFAYTRSDFDAADFVIVRGGAVIHTVNSAVVKGRDPSVNADFVFGDVLGVRNRNPGNVTSNVIGWVRVKWRV